MYESYPKLEVPQLDVRLHAWFEVQFADEQAAAGCRFLLGRSPPYSMLRIVQALSERTAVHDIMLLGVIDYLPSHADMNRIRVGEQIQSLLVIALYSYAKRDERPGAIGQLQIEVMSTRKFECDSRTDRL